MKLMTELNILFIQLIVLPYHCRSSRLELNITQWNYNTSIITYIIIARNENLKLAYKVKY